MSFFMLLALARCVQYIKIGLLISALCCGLGRTIVYQNHLIDIDKHLTDGPFDCKGTIIESSMNTHSVFQTSYTVQVHSLIYKKKELLLSTTILIKCIKKAHISVGDNVLFFNLFKRSAKNTTSPLQKEGIAAHFFIPQLSYRKLASHSYWRSWCYKTRLRILQSFKKRLSSSTFALSRTLFFGEKSFSAASIKVKNACCFWGILHYLARSGLHVIIIMSFFAFLLRCLPLYYMTREILLILLLLLYALLTIPSISFNRAIITYLLCKICVFQNLSYKPLHLVTITTLFVLIYNPTLLFFLDFQLSFGLTLALSWFNEVNKKIQRHYNTIDN